MNDPLKNRAPEKPQESQSAQQVESARAGDRAAFAELVTLYHERIFRMAYYRTGSKMEAEDLTQDIFTRAFTRLPTLREADRFRPWLFSIAVNRIRDFKKRKRILVFFGLDATATEAEFPEEGSRENRSVTDPITRKEFWAQVRRLMDTLSRGEREVFLLRFFDQLSIREIAQTLSKSQSAVKTLLYRAIDKFRQSNELNQFLDGDLS